MPDAKIFGIGFHKTGTKSLAGALRQLGYRVTGSNWTGHPDIARDARELAFGVLDRFDAFQDNPWPLLYRELDERCPGSRFILTIRPTERWLASALRHFDTVDTPMREWIYGVGHPSGNEDVYRERYERHNREVQDYFRDRPQDLLVMRITDGDGWETLCRFLGKPVPDLPFPHENSAGVRERRGARRATR
jgi:hypothetical protein